MVEIIIHGQRVGFSYTLGMASSFSSGTADIYIFADVIENGMELVGQKEIQEYIQNHIQLVIRL